jgi:hypothetical protein
MADSNSQHDHGLTRRGMLIAGGAIAGVAGLAGVRRAFRPRAIVFTARGQRYDGDLAKTIRDGLIACGEDPGDLRGKRVLLKPNLVEPSKAIPHMTTHPAVIIAAAEVFRGFGAEVTVGEAPGHVRDTLMALDETRRGPLAVYEQSLLLLAASPIEPLVGIRKGARA